MMFYFDGNVHVWSATLFAFYVFFSVHHIYLPYSVSESFPRAAPPRRPRPSCASRGTRTASTWTRGVVTPQILRHYCVICYIYHHRHQRSDVTFESHEAWLPALQLQVVQLGQALNGAQDAAAFPLMTLLDELEEIAATLVVCGSGAPRGWATRCLVSVGLAHGPLVESYMQLFEEWAGKAPEKLLHVVVSTTDVLQSWTRGAAE